MKRRRRDKFESRYKGDKEYSFALDYRDDDEDVLGTYTISAHNAGKELDGNLY